MKSKRTRSGKERIELQWPVDRHDGFQKATLIYDKAGRLMAVDYEAVRIVPPVTLQPLTTDVNA